MTLNLHAAKQIIATAMKTGIDQAMKPLSVVVVDAGGHVIAFERGDGAPPGRFDIALGKAYGSVMLGIGGTAQRDRAEAQSYFVLAANGAYNGKLIPVPGGILVRDDAGQVIGAVGVTGDTSENDLAAGAAGIASAGLTADG
ncbi:GlcG/HbpS family heme-binding protein [Aliiroseovarius lamellibrachiae]|uniref:GlcG/HbpS family heme-binding protein n=1 Tax=Aliiroseovarius lamellibrachiae TaxID=1924933 RepID=UPI001BE1062B|nr:heme-binding protein [Aliiroseovarius lamellibrachiae]MBT2131092.1 heme-binding protein [Aliiroseovarius lamellibrachiae]